MADTLHSVGAYGLGAVKGMILLPLILPATVLWVLAVNCHGLLVWLDNGFAAIRLCVPCAHQPLRPPPAPARPSRLSGPPLLSPSPPPSVSHPQPFPAQP